MSNNQPNRGRQPNGNGFTNGFQDSMGNFATNMNLLGQTLNGSRGDTSEFGRNMGLFGAQMGNWANSFAQTVTNPQSNQANQQGPTLNQNRQSGQSNTGNNNGDNFGYSFNTSHSGNGGDSQNRGFPLFTNSQGQPPRPSGPFAPTGHFRGNSNTRRSDSSNRNRQPQPQAQPQPSPFAHPPSGPHDPHRNFSDPQSHPHFQPHPQGSRRPFTNPGPPHPSVPNKPSDNAPMSPAELFKERGNALYRARDFEGAIGQYRAAIVTSPADRRQGRLPRQHRDVPPRPPAV